MNEIIKHYDNLIEENNDPVHDPQPLKDYMDKWDGQNFIDDLMLDETKSVLEIGVGTGRLAVRTAPLCKHFTGIDISPKTVKRAKKNLKQFSNTQIICIDLFDCKPEIKFDVIYSSLTFMHIKEKKKAIEKITAMLNDGGRFVLSVDKNQDNFIDMGTRKLEVFPDNQDYMSKNLTQAGLQILKQYETEFAWIFIAGKNNDSPKALP